MQTWEGLAAQMRGEFFLFNGLLLYFSRHYGQEACLNER